MTLGGILLCGGQSVRMGRPKAWLPFLQQPLLSLLAQRLMPACSSLVIVAAEGQTLPELPAACEIVHDPEPDLGPLQGFVAGLETLHERCDIIFLMACDAPFLHPQLPQQLADRLGDADMVIPRIGEQLYPLTAIYRTNLLPQVRARLERRRLRMRDLVQIGRAHEVAEAELRTFDPDLLSFLNVNRPADYDKALSLLRDGARWENWPLA